MHIEIGKGYTGDKGEIIVVTNITIEYHAADKEWVPTIHYVTEKNRNVQTVDSYTFQGSVNTGSLKEIEKD